jgi:NADPH-dependent glutamate synthase beta subunit-like oxidoreductase/Pyruvate/2-oxoacid:ferredoxin oxidoreductase delta subunit
MAKNHTFRRYEDGDHEPLAWAEEIFKEDTSHQCPTYVHKTPPCQGSCPSGEDIRGWLDIVRGMEKPPENIDWKEYAFQRSTDANPFPSIMGRVCPAPCEDGCNRNEVEDHVGINSVEQFIGDQALKNNLKFTAAEKDSGKKIAIIGGGPAGLAAAYQLRRMGHGATVIDTHSELGGMMRYGIPGYRTPRDVLDGEISRILEMGVETRMNTRVGTDISMEEIEKEFEAVLIAIGAQTGSPLPVPGADASNCISGVAFLEAFNDGRLKSSASKVVVVGGGDTAMDVVSVAKRLGHIKHVSEKDRVENIVLGHTAHDVATAAKKDGAEVILTYRRPVDKMPVAQYEIEAANSEGVEIRGSLAPVEVIKGEDGRAIALRVVEVDWESGKMVVKEGSEHDIECDLIVSAIGQSGDLTGMEHLGNERNLIDSDSYYQIKGKPGYFVAGDIIRPHLLTTAIGQASIACESIDHYLKKEENTKRSKVDVHHFNLLNKLREDKLSPDEYDHETEWGTDTENFAVHNYEDRSKVEIIPADELFLGHFEFDPRHRRKELIIKEEEVIGHFQERLEALSEEDVIDEAKRCMSCGMCFECDNCVIYCPQLAVKRTPKDLATTGRYVYTDYDRCIGCHICAEVCPTGYIIMGMGA